MSIWLHRVCCNLPDPSGAEATVKVQITGSNWILFLCSSVKRTFCHFEGVKRQDLAVQMSHKRGPREGRRRHKVEVMQDHVEEQRNLTVQNDLIAIKWKWIHQALTALQRHVLLVMKFIELSSLLGMSPNKEKCLYEES